MIRPPSGGPSRLAAPQTPENRPWMRPRSSRVKMSPTMVMEIGWTPPAPRPCRARKKISWSSEPAAPESAEPSRNRATAMWKTRRRP